MFSVKGLFDKSNFLTFCKFALWLKNYAGAWAPQVEANQYINSQTMLGGLSKNKRGILFIGRKESTWIFVSHK